MKIGSNKSGKIDPPGKGSKRHYSNEGEKKKQEKMEGKNTPFQNSLRDAEKRGKQVFWWDDKKKQASDSPFKGSRPIATNVPGKKVPDQIQKRQEQPAGLTDKIKPFKVPAPSKPVATNTPKAETTVKKITETKNKGSRGQGVVKNTLLRKIDAAMQPDKYGAPSNQGKNVNVVRSKNYSKSKTKTKGYEVNMGGNKVQVKKMNPKSVIKAAKEKGYIK